MFIFPPCYVALCASKARHRFGSEKVSWCLETSLFLRLPSREGAPSLLFCPFFCLLYFSLPPFEDLGCFSGCLMSSAGIQKWFCGIYSAFKCSFDPLQRSCLENPRDGGAWWAAVYRVAQSWTRLKQLSSSSSISYHVSLKNIWVRFYILRSLGKFNLYKHYFSLTQLNITLFKILHKNNIHAHTHKQRQT